MTTLNLADGESFVKGRNPETAQELLGYAGKKRTSEVRTTSYGYIVPTDILPEGYDAITSADLPAVRTEPGTSTNVDEVYNKGGEPTATATANVSRETEDDADAEAQAAADAAAAAEAEAAAKAEADAEAQALADELAAAEAAKTAELYDPSAHNISEVEAYLEEADEDERARVFAAEAAGKNRKGITDLATTPEGAK